VKELRKSLAVQPSYNDGSDPDPVGSLQVGGQLTGREQAV